jgi:L-amino acid N-acyltransferase YncA
MENTLPPQLMIEGAKSADLAQIKVWAETTLASHSAAFPFAFSNQNIASRHLAYDYAFLDQDGQPIAQSATMFTARWDGEMVGYVCLSAHAKFSAQTYGNVEVEDIFVRPDKRGQGIAAMLLKHVIKQRDASDWDNLNATVWSGNAASDALFQRAGFTPKYTTYRSGPMRQARDIKTPAVPKRSLWDNGHILSVFIFICGCIVGRSL